MKHMKVSAKLITSFLAVIVLAVAVAPVHPVGGRVFDFFLRVYFPCHFGGKFFAPDSVAQRDGHGAFGFVLPHYVAVQVLHHPRRRKSVASTGLMGVRHGPAGDSKGGAVSPPCFY